MLYRSNVEEMMAVYNRNDIYEEGLEKFSMDKLANQLPVMIITGDIPSLEATTDKDKSIVVDVEYINYQNPEYSFTMKSNTSFAAVFSCLPSIIASARTEEISLMARIASSLPGMT